MKLNQGEKLYHIGLSANDIKGAKYAIIPGDPGRCEKIASKLDNNQYLTMNREYKSYLGYIENEPVIVCSTGIGGPSAAICIEELSMIGVENFIRVGTCGGINLNVEAGDIVVVDSAIRMEGTSKEYLPIEFPASANFEITSALVNAVKKLDYTYHVGTVQCKDSFYGQHSPNRMPVSYELNQKWQAWIKGGALASEMESAALFIVCASLGLKAGAVMLTVWNQERQNVGMEQNQVHDTEKAIITAIEALRILIREN